MASRWLMADTHVQSHMCDAISDAMDDLDHDDVK